MRSFYRWFAVTPADLIKGCAAVLAALIMTGLVAGCATKPPVENIGLPASFWQDKAGIIGVAMFGSPKGTLHMYGPQDALDKAIAKSAQDPQLFSYLETLRPAAFTQLADRFAARLREKGYTVTMIDQPLEREPFARLGTKDPDDKVDGDLSTLHARYGIERLLLLSVVRLGLYRDYFVFVPTETPMATFQVDGMLINLADSALLWRAAMAESENLVAIDGKWEQPPDYPNVTQAVRRAEHDAMIYLENAFFHGMP